MKRRWPLLLFIAAGIFLWRGGFGLLPTERTVTWRLKLPYGDVRRLELQVWEDGELLARQERATPQGLTEEPQLKVPLRRGPHRAVAMVWVEGATAAQVLQKDFDPADEPSVVIEPSPSFL